MDDCCNDKASELKELSARQGRVLVIVLIINLTMFFIEAAYGWRAQSTSLLADSLDMLGDAFVYAVSIYAIGKNPRWTASISTLKGSVMVLCGVSVVIQAVYRYISPGLPVAETMGIVGGLALAANLICAILLLRHLGDDLNMRSTWLCSRNDVIANIGVLVAAAAVSAYHSKYPDLVVGLGISVLVLRSAVHVLQRVLA
jgi:cation diffusion facilitator family transporter